MMPSNEDFNYFKSNHLTSKSKIRGMHAFLNKNTMSKQQKIEPENFVSQSKKGQNLKKNNKLLMSCSNHVESPKNEVSILLVITDDLNSSRNNINDKSELICNILKNENQKLSNIRRKKLKPNQNIKNLDRFNYFNSICSSKRLIDATKIEEDKKQSNMKETNRNRNQEKIKKLKHSTNLPSLDEFYYHQPVIFNANTNYGYNDENNDFLINQSNRRKNKSRTTRTPRHKSVDVDEKKYNIYGLIRLIPSTHNRPPLPPMFRNKFWSIEPPQIQSDPESFIQSSVVNKFLNMNYESDKSPSSELFELDSSTSSSSSLDSEYLNLTNYNQASFRNESFEFKRNSNPAKYNQRLYENFEEKPVEVGDRPNKISQQLLADQLLLNNLNMNVSYVDEFSVNDFEDSNVIYYSGFDTDDSDLSDEEQEKFRKFQKNSQRISRQNRFIFIESDSNPDETVKYEANLPHLPETTSISGLNFLNSVSETKSNNNVGLKYVKKKDIGHGLKSLNSLNRNEVKNLSVIAEEDYVQSSRNSIAENSTSGSMIKQFDNDLNDFKYRANRKNRSPGKKDNYILSTTKSSSNEDLDLLCSLIKLKTLDSNNSFKYHNDRNKELIVESLQLNEENLIYI